jgi:hypothetical protein
MQTRLIVEFISPYKQIEVFLSYIKLKAINVKHKRKFSIKLIVKKPIIADIHVLYMDLFS